ncbi:hypothetical protein K8I31_12305 [bacterium]|nr:hypothetical protein [bacterium]
MMRKEKMTPEDCVLAEWQVVEIKQALKEADAGDFAAQEEIDALNSIACVKIPCGKRACIRRGESAIDTVMRTQSAYNSGNHYKKLIHYYTQKRE